MKVAGQVQKIAIMCIFLSACGAIKLNPPKVAAALDLTTTRTVTVYLMVDPEVGYVPVYQDRIIAAERVTTDTKTRAKAKKTVQGIETIFVGDSCESLMQIYAGLQECKEVDSIVRHYGEIESTATTDSEGFSVLELGAADYRLSMQTWQTFEDNKCSWSGSEILPVSSRVIELTMLVFCE